MRMIYMICMAALLFGCTSPSVSYYEGQIASLTAQVRELNTTSHGLEAEIAFINGKNLELMNNYPADISKCRAELNASQTYWTANATKYSFTCANVPLTYPYPELTAYACYWQIRSQYGFGKYYSPMEVCVMHNIAGWPESCACVNEMREIYGVEVQTRNGTAGVEVVIR